MPTRVGVNQPAIRYALWYTNIDVENLPFVDHFPIGKPIDFHIFLLVYPTVMAGTTNDKW